VTGGYESVKRRRGWRWYAVLTSFERWVLAREAHRRGCEPYDLLDEAVDRLIHELLIQDVHHVPD